MSQVRTLPGAAFYFFVYMAAGRALGIIMAFFLLLLFAAAAAATECGTCPENAQCTMVGDVGTCFCNAGYTGTECVDIDECAEGTHACEQLVCHNYPGSHGCDCPPTAACTNALVSSCGTAEIEPICYCGMGASSGGTSPCADIDECAAGSHNCDQICVNRDGGFDCACYEGFMPEGADCVRVSMPPTAVAFLLVLFGSVAIGFYVFIRKI